MSLKKPVTNLKKADGRSWVLYVRISTTLHFSHRYRNNLLEVSFRPKIGNTAIVVLKTVPPV